MLGRHVVAEHPYFWHHPQTEFWRCFHPVHVLQQPGRVLTPPQQWAPLQAPEVSRLPSVWQLPIGWKTLNTLQINTQLKMSIIHWLFCFFFESSFWSTKPTTFYVGGLYLYGIFWLFRVVSQCIVIIHVCSLKE